MFEKFDYSQSQHHHAKYLPLPITIFVIAQNIVEFSGVKSSESGVKRGFTKNLQLPNWLHQL